ncbi:MAG: hypothetical protein LUG18_04130 [Candidatus Azobacteroides sp.]|nr:hypothetical protein [Candidatus Azobacteroides sp.]
MDKETLQTNFIKMLTGKIADRSELVKFLMKLLDIEKESAYRRLRGEVYFSFYEIAMLAEALGISLDNMIGYDLEKTQPFTLVMADFESPSEKDYEICESYVRLLEVVAKNKNTQCTETWTSLPIPMTYQYPHLSLFYLLKWRYQFKTPIPLRKYEEIKFSERYVAYQQKAFEESKKIAHTEYILSATIFIDLINDIKHFYLLQLITKQDILKIQQEIFDYLNYLEHLTTAGSFGEDGTRFSLYISDIHVDLNQSYIESDAYNLCMVYVLSLNAIISVEGKKNVHIKNWLLGQKRLSTLISGTGEKEKIEFFRRQREYAATLSSL